MSSKKSLEIDDDFLFLLISYPVSYVKILKQWWKQDQNVKTKTS